MSHVKSGGATRQSPNVPGKRLGVKKYEGQAVKNGNIIIKQNGSIYHPGKNVKMARDFAIYAVKDGYVHFRMMSGHKRGKFYVDIVEESANKAEAKVEA